MKKKAICIFEWFIDIYSVVGLLLLILWLLDFIALTNLQLGIILFSNVILAGIEEEVIKRTSMKG